MTVETDSHHVENFALVPIGGWPDVRDGIDDARVLGEAQFQTQMKGEGHGVKLVNHLKAGLFPEVIDTRNIEEIIERDFVAAEPGDFAEIGGRDGVGGFAAELRFLEELGAE